MKSKYHQIILLSLFAIALLMPRAFVFAQTSTSSTSTTGSEIIFEVESLVIGEICIEFSGNSVVESNGVYVDTGTTQNDFNVWKNQDYDYWISHTAGGYWVVTPTEVWATNDRYLVNSNVTPPIDGNVTWQGNGGHTVGTAIEVACPGGEPTATSTTLSIDSSPHLYFYGIVIFFLGFYAIRKI